jgi:hypothetical protein
MKINWKGRRVENWRKFTEITRAGSEENCDGIREDELSKGQYLNTGF